jgi:ABC-2 type transport system ATP-binding protein
MPQGSEPVVTAHEVTRAYGKLVALDKVTFDVEPGTILGVIGPSGSGKTTLVRTLTGTLRPSSGTVRVLGEDPLKFHRRTRERIGYMPQHFVLYDELTAAENLVFEASLFGLLWKRRRARVRAMLELVELWDARSRRAKDLSGGMQRRLELACALVHDPLLLFVDEPTAGLDPMLRQTVWDEFRRLRDLGRTLVVTTQYVGEAEYCDRVAVLAEGRLLALDEPEALRRLALGGEVVEVQTTRAFDGSALLDVPGVKDVRQSQPRTMLVVAEEAGAATPRILEAITEHGGQVVSASEYRPSFDEVFAEIVQRQQAAERPAEAGARAAADVRRAA